MKTQVSQLSAPECDLLNTCIAWHIRPHLQVFLEGLSAISMSLRFDNLSVLELGATSRSTVSPFLLARGARPLVTCYSSDELARLEKTCSLLVRQYRLKDERLRIEQADIFSLNLNERFDLVVLKDVLGGVNRRHDQAEFRKAIDNCLAVLNSNGNLLIIDKGRSSAAFHWILRKFGAAGRQEWHYFTFDELQMLIPRGNFKTVLNAHGILSFGDFGGGVLQNVADFLDEYVVEKLVPLEKRAVFSLCISKM